MPPKADPTLLRTLQTILLAGILGVGGAGVRIAERTLEKIGHIEIKLAEVVTEAADDRKDAATTRESAKKNAADVAELNVAVAGLRARVYH